MKKRLISIFLTGAMMISMTACNSRGDNQADVNNTQNSDQAVHESVLSEDGDEFQYPMEPITLTINATVDGGDNVYDDSKHPEWAKDIYYQKVMRDATGVTLKDVGGASNATTLSDSFLLMLAGGELPDIIIAPWQLAYTGGSAAAIDDGYVVDLMEYAEYMPNMMKYLDENPDLAAQFLTTDGRLAGAPFVKDKPIVGMGLVIRQDWLDEVGKEAPETVEELHDVLVAFKEKYNCKAPLTFESRWLFQQGAAAPLSSAWGVTYTDYVVDGKVQFGPLVPEYRDFVQTLADWFSEGLIDPDFASVDKATVQAKFSSGESGVSIQQINNIESSLAANKGTEYAVVALPSLVMNKGDEPQFSQQSILRADGGFNYSISTTCSDIEAACRYLDWRFTEEGQMTMNYGVEGVTYEVVDGQVQFTDLVMNNPDTPNPGNARDEIAWVQNRAGISLDISAAYTDHAKEWIDVWTAHMDQYVLPMIPYTVEQQESISDKWGDIDSMCQEQILKYVIGSEDMSTWDSFVESIKKLGAEEVLAVKQEAYDAYLEAVASLQ